MVEPIAPDGCAHLAGDGEYAVEVVGVTAFQDTLEWLARGRGETPTDYACTAVLVPEPEDSEDPDAVAVTILGEVIGFLAPEAAEQMRSAMDAWGFDQATCEALVEGGWYRTTDDKGDFQVWLDINPGFIPAPALVAESEQESGAAADDDATVATAEPLDDDVGSTVVMPTVPPRKAGISLRELSMAAAAVAVVLAAAGLAWMVRLSGTTVVGADGAMSVPAPPLVTERQRLAARVAWVGPTLAIVGPEAASAVASVRSVLRAVTTMPSRSPVAEQPVEFKTQSPSLLPVVPTPQAKSVASPEAKAVVPETEGDSPHSRTILSTTRAAAATAPQRPRRQSALSIGSVPPVRPHDESAVGQPTSAPEIVGPPVVGRAQATGLQENPISAPPPASPAAPRPAASARTEAMAPVSAPAPKRAIVPGEPHADEAKRPRSHTTPHRSRTESKRSRPHHHHRWLHRTTGEEPPPTLRPLPPPPSPATRAPRPLRPGETMATRLFEDGVKEWTEKAIPAAMAPRYAPY